MLSATNRERHSHVIFGTFKILTSLAIIKSKGSFHLVVSKAQSEVEKHRKLIIDEVSWHDNYIEMEKINYFKQTVSHLNSNDYAGIYDLFEEIKFMITNINESTLTVNKVKVDHLPYPDGVLGFFNQDFEMGDALVSLVVRFRKGLSDIILGSKAGAQLIGECNICK